jgi:uncharacterized membrane protein HdeD (DUF308 family)
MVEEIKYNETIKRDGITNFMLNFIIMFGLVLVVNGLIYIIYSFWKDKKDLGQYWESIEGYEKHSFLFKIGLYTSLNYNIILLIILLL